MHPFSSAQLLPGPTHPSPPGGGSRLRHRRGPAPRRHSRCSQRPVGGCIGASASVAAPALHSPPLARVPQSITATGSKAETAPPDSARLVPLVVLKTATPAPGASDDGAPATTPAGRFGLLFGRGRHLLRNCRVLGVVTKPADADAAAFVLDDGSATAVVHLPAAVVRGAEPGIMAGPEAGQLVEVIGRVREDRAIDAVSFFVQHDPMFEPMRWLEIVTLFRNHYDVVVVPPHEEAEPAGGGEADGDPGSTPQWPVSATEAAEIEAAMEAAMLASPTGASQALGSQALGSQLGSQTPAIGEFAQQIDTRLRDAGGDGMELVELMMEYSNDEDRAKVHNALAELQRGGHIYEMNDRYFTV